MSCKYLLSFFDTRERHGTPDSVQHFKGIPDGVLMGCHGMPRHENHELPPPRPAAQFQAKKVIQDWNALPEAGNLNLKSLSLRPKRYKNIAEIFALT